MPTKLLTGSFVALITPFNKDGSVDFGAFRTLLKFQEQHGTSAVLIMGSTGETSMLAAEEKREIIVETAKMKTPRMPIFFGCTGNNTEATIANVRFAKANGADGAILAAPAYICAPAGFTELFLREVAECKHLQTRAIAATQCVTRYRVSGQSMIRTGRDGHDLVADHTARAA